MAYCRFAFILLFAFVSIQCSPAGTGTHQPEQLQIVEADNGKLFETAINSTITVSLNQCVGCADQWTLASKNHRIVSLTDQTVSNRSCTNCDGGKAKKVFHFKCVSKGSEKLTFTYFKRIFQVTLDVR